MLTFNSLEWLGIGVTVLIMGMSKGGFPVSGITLPILVLIWPEQGEAARSAVSFMLPLLCVMDIVGVILYRGKPDWSHIKKLLPGTIAGITVASIFFVSASSISFSDRSLKLVIGLLGLFFTFFQVYTRIKGTPASPSAAATHKRASVYGFSAGLTSTIAHAAGPVMQMYFLPTGLAKSQFAATTVYFFLFLNAIKLIPFALLGRFSKEQLVADLWRLPIIPFGVLIGDGLVKIMKEEQYIRFIYVTLALTSLLLIYRAVTGS